MSESDQLASIDRRLAAIETELGIGAKRRRRFRFTLQTMFWVLALAAALSLATASHLKTQLLEAENARLNAAKASLESTMRTLVQQRSQSRSTYSSHVVADDKAVEKYEARRKELMSGPKLNEEQ